jgi:heme-degrading monooxygenase HmoA
MSVIRLIYVSVEPDQGEEAESIWRNQCAPLMIQQKGCLSERLFKCIGTPGEYVSYSEWDTVESIDNYRTGPTHEEIKNHTKNMKGSRPVVKTYEVVP